MPKDEIDGAYWAYRDKVIATADVVIAIVSGAPNEQIIIKGRALVERIVAAGIAKQAETAFVLCRDNTEVARLRSIAAAHTAAARRRRH